MTDNNTFSIGEPAADQVALRFNPAPILSLALGLGAVGLVLRIAGARGSLWLDEIWSLDLIEAVKTGKGILWAIDKDNNHYLNTLYLWLVGPYAPVLVQRLFSIVLGSASVLAAGLLERRAGRAAMLTAMTLFAVAYPMVDMGSEARGYAGMILCALLAIAATERAAQAPDRRNFLLLAGINLAGVLFHPLMLSMTAALIGWRLWIAWHASRSLPRAAAEVGTMFLWTFRLLAPLFVLIGIATRYAGGYILLGYSPFTLQHFVDGVARLFQALLGLPSEAPKAATLALVLIVTALALFLQRRDRTERTSLYVILILGLPAVMLFGRIPNAEIARYYILPGMALLLLLSELGAQLCRDQGAARAICALLLAAVGAGNIAEDWRLASKGRDQAAAMIETIVAEGPATVTSNSEPRDQAVISYLAWKLGAPLTYAWYSDFCSARPRWFLTSDPRPLPQVADIGQPGPCVMTFRRVATAPGWGLSGLSWTLYHAAD